MMLLWLLAALVLSVAVLFLLAWLDLPQISWLIYVVLVAASGVALFAWASRRQAQSQAGGQTESEAGGPAKNPGQEQEQ